MRCTIRLRFPLVYFPCLFSLFLSLVFSWSIAYILTVKYFSFCTFFSQVMKNMLWFCFCFCLGICFFFRCQFWIEVFLLSNHQDFIFYEIYVRFFVLFFYQFYIFFFIKIKKKMFDSFLKVITIKMIKKSKIE